MLRNVCLFLFLFGCQLMSAQTKETLSTVIDFLSKNYNITFSYNAKEIDNKTLVASSIIELNKLSEAIQSIENQTGLIIEKVDLKNYIIINEKYSSNKSYDNYLCGKIVNIYSEPISFSSISVGSQITKTDSEGYFYSTNLNQESSISIKAEDFKLKYVPIGLLKKETCTSIVLEQEIIELDEVVINNYLVKGLVKNENGSIEIDVKKTGALPGVIEPDAIQSLQFIPGLQSPDETVTGLHIRGSTPDQNLVLFDDVKVYQNSHFFGLLSVYNPYVIDHIKLFRSATKAKYGGHAGGVISIQVDKDIPDKITAGIGATLTHINGDIKIPLIKDKLALFAAARRGSNQFLNTITFQQYSDVAFQNTNASSSLNITEETDDAEPSFLYEDYFAKLIYKPHKSLHLDFGFIKNQNDLSFSNINPFFESDANDNLNVSSNTGYSSASYESKSLGSHKIQISTTSFNKKFKGLGGFDFSFQRPTLLEVTFDKENSVKETTIQYHGKKKISKNSKLQIGYQRNYTSVAYTADSYGLDLRTFQEFFSGDETSQSFYSDFVFRTKKLHLNIGGRRQFFNRLHDVFWEPRLFLNYNLFSNFWLKGSYERKHQSVSQVTDLRNDGLGELFNRLWVVSTDESIPIIENDQVGFGFDFQTKGWTIDVEMYSKKLEGIGILLNDNIFEPRNVSGNNNVRGIDMLLKKNWRYYSSWLSYSYANSEYQFKEINNNRPFRGAFDIPHSIVWTNSLTFKNFSVSIGYQYRNGVPYTEKQLNINNPQGNFITFEEFNGRRLPDYKRLDLTTNYNFYVNKTKKIRATVGLTLQNITNSKNILSRDFRVVERFDANGDFQLNTPVLSKIERVSLGFTPNFIFRLNI